MDPREDTLYTLDDVARRLGMSLAQVGTWCREGTLPAVKYRGHWRVPKGEFEIWMLAYVEERNNRTGNRSGRPRHA